MRNYQPPLGTPHVFLAKSGADSREEEQFGRSGVGFGSGSHLSLSAALWGKVGLSKGGPQHGQPQKYVISAKQPWAFMSSNQPARSHPLGCISGLLLLDQERNAAHWIHLDPEVQRKQWFQLGALWSLLGCPKEPVGQRWEAEFFKVKSATNTSPCCGHWSKVHFRPGLGSLFCTCRPVSWLRPDVWKEAMPRDPAPSPPLCSWPLTEQFWPLGHIANSFSR